MEHVFNIGMTYALLDAIHYLCKWLFCWGTIRWPRVWQTQLSRPTSAQHARYLYILTSMRAS